MKLINYGDLNSYAFPIANGERSKHLGVSGSTRYLLPILFTERMLSTEVLKKCQQAMGVRNNIVHAGQRDIKTDLAEELVLALKQCSEILMEYTIIE